MKLLTKFILILLSTAYSNTFYKCTQNQLISYPVHPIAQECNKNAKIIQEYCKQLVFFPLKFPDIIDDNSIQVNQKIDSQLKIYILPLWLILEKTEEGTLNSVIVFAE